MVSWLIDVLVVVEVAAVFVGSENESKLSPRWCESELARTGR